MPPSLANAMAKRPSVTVSMAALRIGTLIVMWRETCVEQSTSLGITSDLAGTNTTSSKVNPIRVLSQSAICVFLRKYP